MAGSSKKHRKNVAPVVSAPRLKSEKDAGVQSAVARGKRRVRDDTDENGDEDDDEDDDDDDDEVDGDDDEEEEEEDGGDAYGRAIFSQLGIDPSSIPKAHAPASAPSTKDSVPMKSKKTTSQQQHPDGRSALNPTSKSERALQSTAETRAGGGKLARRQPETVVFDGAGTSSASSGARREVENTFVDSKAARKAFMSSRIERIGVDANASAKGKGKGKATGAGEDDEDQAQEKEHKANDRLLSHLLSTTLFAPGADASSSPSTRRNGKPSLDPSKGTLASVLELSTTHEQRKGAALGRGWGDAQARLAELGKVPARIRAGLKQAAQTRVSKEQDRARELGLVHRSLQPAGSKRRNMGGTGAVSAVDMALSGVGASKGSRDRVRGLGMGVGKFGAGKLTISARDVEKINGPSPSRGGAGAGGRGGRRGGRGGGGGGGGRGGGPARKKQRRS